MLRPRSSRFITNSQRALRPATSLTRSYVGHATQEQPSGPKAGPNAGRNQTRVQTVFGALLAVGIACTAYGLYDFYSMLTVWPPELRGDLRSAVKAKRQKDLVSAEAFFRKALATADTLSDEQLDLLKRTGISIALAEVLSRSQAYNVLADAHARMDSPTKSLTPRERVRAVAIALRLAELARRPEDEERWGVRAVEDALRILQDAAAEARPEDDGLELPAWVTRTDVAAPLERLGAFYARRGQPEYALALYLRGVDVLGGAADAADRCRAAQLMNNIAELIAQRATPERLEQAKAWAAKGCALGAKARGELKGDEALTCDRTCAVLLFNLGQLCEMLGDTERAKGLFQRARVLANNAQFPEGAQQAVAALMRLRLQTAAVPDSTPNGPDRK